MEITQSLAMQWLEALTQSVGASPELLTYETEDERLILCARFADQPESGLSTCFTLGVSQGDKSLKELQLTLQTNSEEWVEALFEFSDILLAESVEPMAGALYHMHAQLSPGSSLDSWVIGPVKSTFSIGPLQLVYYACYPLAAAEFDLIEKVGLLKFLQALGDRAYDPKRPLMTS